VRGLGSIEYVQNRFQNSIDVFMHLVVPEISAPDNPLPPISECGRFVRRGMLPAIDFDNEMRVRAKEIYHVTVDRHLPLELQAIESSVAQTEPEDSLRICLIGAKAPRS
jgi:hypothetical protein